MFAEGKMSHFLCCAIKDAHMERNIFESWVHKADQQVPCEKPANASAYSLLNNLSRCWELKNHHGFNCTPLCQVQAPIPRWRNNFGAPGPLQGLCKTGKKGGWQHFGLPDFHSHSQQRELHSHLWQVEICISCFPLWPLFSWNNLLRKGGKNW